MSALQNICRITAFNLKIFIKQGEGAQLHGCHTASRQCAEKKSHLNCVSSAILLADCVRQKDGIIMLEHHLEHLLNLAKPSPFLLAVGWTTARKRISQLACSSLSRIKHVLFLLLLFLFCLGRQYSAQACLLIDGEVSREHSSSVCEVWSHVARPFLSWIRTTYPARLSPIVLFYHWPFLNTSQVVISPSAAHQTLFKPARKKNSYLPQQWAHRLTLSGECWQRSQLPPVWTWGQA